MVSIAASRVPACGLITLAVALLLTTMASGANGATCQRTDTALTSECASLCYEGRPCIAYSADANLTACTVGSAFSECKLGTSGSCAYECFTNGPSDNVAHGIVDFSTYTFLIPFGASKSNWEANWSTSERDAYEKSEATEADWTGSLPSKSNDVLQNVEPLSFLPATKKVVIAGGKSSDGTRGKVAKLSISTELLSAQTQLEAVTLANLQLDQYPQSTFPTQLKNFSMVNCVMKEYPADIPFMTSLQVLDLSKNYFVDYPVKFSLAQLKVLNLSTNSLTSFDGDFPNVTTLDLSGNTLTSIPLKVFAMTKLKNLYLGANSFSSVVLTTDQATFLSALSLLSVDTFGSPTTCAASAAVQQVGGVAVCVSTSASGSTGGTDTSTTGSSSNTGAIVGGILGGIALIAIIAGFIWYQRRNASGSSNTRTNKSNNPGQTYTFGNGSTAKSSDREAVSLWNDQQLLSMQVNTDEIEDIKKIGSGAYGVVYLAKYRKNTLVACKRLKKDEANLQNTQSFVAEIKLVAKLDHPRIVALVGVAWTIESDLQALFEYMEKGDLRRYLETPSTPRHWTSEKLQIAIDVVEALVYVHSFSPPLVHRDLKSRNVLLTGDFRAKLSDFGIARFRSDISTMTTGVGTGRWLAPEVISGSSDYNQACDIFAFGVVLSEIDTHALPYEDVMGPNGNRLADVAILQMVATGNLLPTFSQMCPIDIVNVAKRCLSLDSNDRPNAVEVAYALRTLQKSNDFYVV